VVVSNISNFAPNPWGKDSQFDEHIFHMGWFNDQPGWLREIKLDHFFESPGVFFYEEVFGMN